MFVDDWCPVRLTFWPSIKELKESKSTNLYLGGLEEYLKAFIELETKLRKAGFRAGVPHGKTMTKVRSYTSTKKGAGAYPDIFIKFIVFIGSTGIAAGLYNILKTWAETKNGRKIKIRIEDFEVEVTQMSEEQFLKFLEKLIDYKQAIRENAEMRFMRANIKKLHKELLEAGYDAQSEGSSTYLAEEEIIGGAAMDSILQRRDKLHGKTSKSQKSKRSNRRSPK